MKWIIAAVVTLVIVAGGAGAYLYMDKNNDAANSSQTKVSQVSGETSISSLFKRNENLKCTYDVTDDTGRNYGTAYFLGDKKMYGEFTNQINANTNRAYVISDGKTQYVWQKDQKTGYKADVSDSTKKSQEEKSSTYDPDQKYQFSCTSWKVDTSKFVPPKDIKFIDNSKLIQDLKNKAGDIKSSVCSSITDAKAKAACQNAL